MNGCTNMSCFTCLQLTYIQFPGIINALQQQYCVRSKFPVQIWGLAAEQRNQRNTLILYGIFLSACMGRTLWRLKSMDFFLLLFKRFVLGSFYIRHKRLKDGQFTFKLPPLLSNLASDVQTPNERDSLPRQRLSLFFESCVSLLLNKLLICSIFRNRREGFDLKFIVRILLKLVINDVFIIKFSKCSHSFIYSLAKLRCVCDYIFLSYI